MPKKPPTNKRPPPKAAPKKQPQPQQQQQPTPAPAPTAPARPTSRPPLGSPANPYLDSLGQPIDFSTFASRPATVDPNDPGFSAALSDWSASTLGKLNALPNFDTKQLNAIAEAAVGGAHSGGVMVPGQNGQGGTVTGLPIDLPASLAALFEAKLTLDREKAKLLRMQKELKAHREQMHGVGNGNGNGVGNGKGKEVALEPEDDCPCGGSHSHHGYAASAHSADYSDEYCCETDEDGVECTTDCGCNCHEYHEDDCDCEQCLAEMEEHDQIAADRYEEDLLNGDDHDHDDEDFDHHHDHGHHHHHGHGHSHGHSHGHGHGHGHGHRSAHIHEIDVELPTPQLQPPSARPPPNIAEQVRKATVQLKNATAEANRASLRAESQQGQGQGQGQNPSIGDGRQNLIGGPPTNLSQDPERLDELVRELFNWIKAVVWTIEQAAVVAGRRNWHDSSVH